MSGQHWIDAFFRKRLERQTFPLEEGEFEEMRALIHQRNSTTTLVRGGGFSKWWLTALLPMAGLLWWAFGEKGAGVEGPPAAKTEALANDQTAQYPSDAGNTTEQKGSGSAIAVSAAVLPSNEAPKRSDKGHIELAPDGRARAQIQGGYQPARSTGIPGGSTDDRTSTGHSGNWDTAVGGSAGSHVNDGSGRRSDQVVGNERSGDQLRSTNMDDGAVRAEQVRTNEAGGTAAPFDQAAIGALEVRPEQEHATTDVQLVTERSEEAVVAFMEPRWSSPAPIEVPDPMNCELPVFKRIPMGELHAFGAPLFVRGRSSSGERSGAEMGSMVGLEYRVRVKRFSWATGVHYGMYALKAGGGATDVTLSFVEVPLLASVRLGRGRLGMMLQGGMSMDLLFNARGRYPVDEDRAGTAFPDEAFRTANYSWSLRPQATYQVTERLSASAGPLWKAQIGEVAKKGPLDGTTVNSSGVSIGLSWRLDHSTF